MTDSSNFGIGRKRKADFALRNEDEDDSSNKQPKGVESYLASEEELKRRRIVKVVRNGSNVEGDNGPKGRFTFMNQTTINNSQISQESKSADTNVLNSSKKITVTTSTIRLNKPQAETPQKIEEKQATFIENINVRTIPQENKSESKNHKNEEESKESKKEEIKIESSSKLKIIDTTEENKPSSAEEKNSQLKQGYQIHISNSNNSINTDKKFNFSERPSIGSVNPAPSDNPFTDGNKLFSKSSPFQNTSSSLGFSSSNFLNTNPFVKRDSTETTNSISLANKTELNLNRNPFAPTSSNLNPFAPTGLASGSFKSSFNFNLASAPSNPNWNSDDEDEGEDLNPEEEIKISGKESRESTQHKPVEIFNPNLIKFLKIQLGDLSEYNFQDKKYQSKGKGDISIELTRTEKEKVVAMCVFRNNAFKILFQGSIINKISFLTPNNKNFKHIIVVQKLFSTNDTTNKPEAKSVRLEFQTENEYNFFKEKFDETMGILDKNDLSAFPEKNVEKSQDKNKEEDVKEPSSQEKNN